MGKVTYTIRSDMAKPYFPNNNKEISATYAWIDEYSTMFCKDKATLDVLIEFANSRKKRVVFENQSWEWDVDAPEEPKWPD